MLVGLRDDLGRDELRIRVLRRIGTPTIQNFASGSARASATYSSGRL